ncbi:zinc finger protein 276 isoform X6 [Cavia porcellus]|uniref:zinc finger protein 276 isoform X6 n=1 Tax=Cavia porcellus TaxID=10141 RepID=UPI002FE0E451
MKRDRLGRFLSPGLARQRGGAGSGRVRGRPARGDGAETLAAAARLGWGSARACGDPVEDGADEAGTGRALATGHCRLCHGKFSSRSLRSISDRASGDSSEKPSPGEPVFVRDFQHLLGVAVHQDPSLSQFVCKSCHAQFYQCHSLLRSFLQRVNVSPTAQRKSYAKVGAQPTMAAEEGVCLVDLITSTPRCLHGLVGWVHGHAASCGALPSLQRTLSSEYCGIIQAVWGCDQGHDYTMDTDSSCRAFLLDNALAVKWPWDKETAPWLIQNRESDPVGAVPQISQGRGSMTGTETKILPSVDTAPPSDGSSVGLRPGPPPQPSLPPSEAPGSLGRRVKAKKPRRLKNQKCGRNLGPSLDGRKSSGVREVRNYICDECGQTFKQRKHLLVHQMRHSGAKPLQCEVCGFQCRQRASLKYHMTKHKAETELDFACDQCGRRFEKAHNLNVHMSMVHPLTQTQDKTLSLEAEPPPGPPSPPGITEGQAVKPEPT